MSAGSVLIVDDERAMCELIDTALSMRKYDTAWCQSADQAMESLGQRDFDVVLTDVKMPGTTGLQLCQQINRLRPDIPVVVMTAFGTLETAVAAMRSGAYDFLTKPVELELLSLTIARAAERRRLTNQIHLLQRQANVGDTHGELMGDSEPMRETGPSGVCGSAW